MTPLFALLASLAAAPASAPAVLWLVADEDRGAAGAKALTEALEASEHLRRADGQPLEQALFDARMARPPDTVRADVEAALRRARDAYRKLAFAEGMRLLQEVENAHLAALSCPEGSALAAQVSLQVGAIDAATRESRRAQERFRTALFVDPAARLDPVFYPPQAVKVFDEVRTGLGALERGSLSLVSEPAGAEVFVDGRPAGRTPATVQVQEGVHYVCVRRPGSRPWTSRLQVAGGRLDSPRVFLEPASRAEAAAQLLALAPHPARLDLADAAVASALLQLQPAAAVAQWVAPDSVRLHVPGAPAASGLLTARAGDTPAERAQDLLAQLEQRLTPAASPEPERGVAPAAAAEPVQLELVGRAALAVEGAVGFHGGVRLGVEVPVLRWLSAALTAGYEASTAPLGYVEPNPPPLLAGRIAGLVQVRGMVPASLELRVTPVRAGSFSLALFAGAELRLVLLGPMQPLEQVGTPFSYQPAVPVPGVSLRLGPTVGLGVTTELTRNLRLLVRLAWTPSAPVVIAAVPTVLQDAGTPRQVVLLPQSPWQHQVSGGLGLAWAFR